MLSVGTAFARILLISKNCRILFAARFSFRCKFPPHSLCKKKCDPSESIHSSYNVKQFHLTQSPLTRLKHRNMFSLHLIKKHTMQITMLTCYTCAPPFLGVKGVCMFGIPSLWLWLCPCPCSSSCTPFVSASERENSLFTSTSSLMDPFSSICS